MGSLYPRVITCVLALLKGAITLEHFYGMITDNKTRLLLRQSGGGLKKPLRKLQDTGRRPQKSVMAFCYVFKVFLIPAILPDRTLLDDPMSDVALQQVLQRYILRDRIPYHLQSNQ